jgi:hypothetical protein
VGFLEGDQAAGELEQREVVLRFLRPADQECAVAVETGVEGLDDPAASAPPGRRSFELELVGAAADVRGVLALRDHLVDGPLVGAVEAQALRAPLARPRPPDRDRVESCG